MSRKTLIVKNVGPSDAGYHPAIGDCLLCGSVGTLYVYLLLEEWECNSCNEKGYFDNIQIEMKLRDDNDAERG